MRAGGRDARARAAAAAPTVSTLVARHYAAFPYPRVVEIEREEPAGRAAGALDWLLGRRGPSALSRRRLRIWVAGCGTEQAARVGLAFDDAEVLATDVSGRSLTIARGLTRQLGLGHVRFERADLLDMRAAGAFDLIFCTGVLHHLADPLAGLRVLEHALDAAGAAVLMLYSRQHRAGFAHFRRGLRAFAGRRGPGVRDAAALLGAVLRSRCRPALADELSQVARDRRRDLPTFADTVLHPHEHDFDLDELMAFVQAGGLSFASWARPEEWEPARYFDDPRVVRHLTRRPALERWRALYWLGGAVSPLFRLVVEKASRPRPAPWSQAEIAGLRVAGVGSRVRHRVRAGRIVETRRVRVAAFRGGRLRLRYAPFYGDETELELGTGAAAALELARAGATVRELTAHRARGSGERLRWPTVRALLPDRLGYLVPVAATTGP